MGKTSIEWTAGDDGAMGSVWNPVRGCSVVSPGCHACYARTIAARFSDEGAPFHGFALRTVHGPQWTGKVEVVPKHLADPLRWKEPRRVFANSMSDLFHEELPNEDIAAVFGVAAAAPQHTFQMLTKRADRMAKWFRWVSRQGVPPVAVLLHHAQRLSNHKTLRNTQPIYERPWPLPNVWIGVSVEDQKRAEERIPWLIEVPAAVRFLSCEPLLGPMNLFGPKLGDTGQFGAAWVKNGVKSWTEYGYEHDVELTAAVDWVIVGSESGPGARPMKEEWARDIVDQCIAADVPVFTKQIATAAGRAAGVPKGGDPKHWPSGNWPREFPSGG